MIPPNPEFCGGDVDGCDRGGPSPPPLPDTVSAVTIDATAASPGVPDAVVVVHVIHGALDAGARPAKHAGGSVHAGEDTQAHTEPCSSSHKKRRIAGGSGSSGSEESNGGQTDPLANDFREERPAVYPILDALRAECDAAFERLRGRCRSRRQQQLQQAGVGAMVNTEAEAEDRYDRGLGDSRPTESTYSNGEGAADAEEDEDADLLDVACAVDVFEEDMGAAAAAAAGEEGGGISDQSPARREAAAYWVERCRVTSDLGLEPGQSDQIKGAILDVIPSCLKGPVLNGYFGADCDRKGLFLFNEHYIVKPPRSSVRFGWHVDEEKQLGTLSPAVRYVSVWCPLDDVCGCNGSLVLPQEGIAFQHWKFVNNSIYPMSEAEIQAATATCPSCPASLPPPGDDDQDSQDRDGEDAGPVGTPVCCRAGSVVVFPSKLPHCSGTNRSSSSRRVFYAQYSVGVIGSSPLEPLCFAVPVQ